MGYLIDILDSYNYVGHKISRLNIKDVIKKKSLKLSIRWQNILHMFYIIY